MSFNQANILDLLKPNKNAYFTTIIQVNIYKDSKHFSTKSKMILGSDYNLQVHFDNYSWLNFSIGLNISQKPEGL